MEKLLKQAKRFLPTLRKNYLFPSIQNILITKEYIIAMDTFRAIRIRHHEDIIEPFLHQVKNTLEVSKVSDYPQMIERYIPNENDALVCISSIDLNEWITLHREALIPLKEKLEKAVTLTSDEIYVRSIEGQEVFRCATNMAQGIELLSYDCKFMLDALKVFKELKEIPNFYYYGNRKLFMLKSENIEIIVSPIHWE